jgi:hypothetical protein
MVSVLENNLRRRAQCVGSRAQSEFVPPFPVRAQGQMEVGDLGKEVWHLKLWFRLHGVCLQALI